MPVRPALSPAELDAVRTLLRAYSATLPPEAQDAIAAELPTLPGRYAPPRGALLLVARHGQPAGCIALRPFDAATGEIKRLFVQPAARGHGLARALVQSAIAAARSAPYARLVLDTLPTMTGALSLYRSLGFQPIAPYNDSRLPGLHHLALLL